MTRAGALTVSVKLSDTTASTSFTIAAPPKILFDMSVAGNRDIYRVSLDGNDLERLTTDPANDVHATMSHGRVVFTSYRDGNAELYVAGAGPSGADLRLTTTTANETQPALSPDGQHLAYLRDDAGAPKVWIAASDATGAARLTKNFGFSASVEGSPAFRAIMPRRCARIVPTQTRSIDKHEGAASPRPLRNLCDFSNIDNNRQTSALRFCES